MSSPFKLIAVLVAAGFCVPAAFAADAVTSASVVPAAQKTQDGAVLEGTKTRVPTQTARQLSRARRKRWSNTSRNFSEKLYGWS